ncbi:MAG TPA: hypothetical protein GX497_08270 [Bacillus bacterium]|nr:hypothetical protein [Bacillus sp. (in: firmicutes)]
MPNPRYQIKRKKSYQPHSVHNELEFAAELTERNFDFQQLQPVPQPKDYDEIEY